LLFIYKIIEKHLKTYFYQAKVCNSCVHTFSNFSIHKNTVITNSQGPLKNVPYKAHVTRDIFGPWISKCQGKLLTKNNSRYLNKTQYQGMFFKSLPWLGIKTCGLKYLFIAILCAKIPRVIMMNYFKIFILGLNNLKLFGCYFPLMYLNFFFQQKLF